MSDDDRSRWDRRYAAGEYATRTHPSALLESSIDRFPRGRALDVACGAGRNARYLAAQGFTVDAVDISAVALERAAGEAAAAGVHVNWIARDLDAAPLPDGPYALIVVSRFLQHALVPQMLDRLEPGGWLLYEQHLRTDDPDVGGPSSARFRLRPQELLHLFAELRITWYYEGIVDDPGGRRMALAQLIGSAPGSRNPPAPGSSREP